MLQQLKTLLALIIAGIIVSVLALIICTDLAGVHRFLGEVHCAVRVVAETSWAGVKILFFVGLALGALEIHVHLRARHRQVGVVYGDVRAILQGDGAVIQLNNPMEMDPAQQIQYAQQILKMAQMMGRTAKQFQTDEQADAPLADEAVPAFNTLTPPRDEFLSLSDDYQPHANEILSGRGLIIGVSGSGKSNSTATLCEELGKLDVPFVLADTEDEYESLRDRRWLKNGLLVDVRTVQVENADQFGRYVLDHHVQAILNLQSYDMDEAALVMIGIIAGLRGWQEERENEARIPCEFLLEEAVTWLPQNVTESPLKGHHAETFAMLQNTFFNDLVRKGRKRGLGLAIICQKIAEIDKRALQCDWKLLHRQSELIDLEKYNKLGITTEETLALANGQGYLFTSKVSKKLVQVRERYTPHGANTPGLSNLRAHRNALRNGDMDEISFEPPTETLRSLRLVNTDVVRMPPKGVPEETKQSILGLYTQGVKRTDIQAKLSLNGDEYWMIKEVCDEYDRGVKKVESE